MAKKKAKKAKEQKSCVFYGDVEVTVKMRLRVSATLAKDYTLDDMLQCLKNEEFDDITDTETLEYLEVHNFENYDENE